MPDTSTGGILAGLARMRSPYAGPGGPQYVVPQQSWGNGPNAITDAQGQPIIPKSSGVPQAIPGVPPWMTGIYRTLYPTPAETGELPPQYWPQNPTG